MLMLLEVVRIFVQFSFMENFYKQIKWTFVYQENWPEFFLSFLRNLAYFNMKGCDAVNIRNLLRSK